MRYAADHKATTRRKLLDAAHAGLRSAGAEGLGVATVTAEAGLTHGAFYAHFVSKEALVAETVARAAERMTERFERRVAGLSPPDALRAQIDHYLSPAHLEAPAGCLLPALCSDAARATAPVRLAYEETLEAFVGLMQRLLDGLGLAEPGLARSMAAEMIGALALARAIADPDRREAMLAAARAALLRRAGLA